MIYGVAIEFGLVAFLLIALVGGYLVLTFAHSFLRKFHEFEDYRHERRQVTLTRKGAKTDGKEKGPPQAR